jgi:hypothetical protein
MNTVDFSGLGKRLCELLRIGPEAVLEISLLKSGDVLVSKSQEDG